MFDDLSLAVRLGMESRDFQRGLRRSERGVERFARGAKAEIRTLGRAVTGIGGQLAGLGIGIGVAAIATQSAQWQKELTQIGQTAGATEAQVGLLDNQILAMSQRTGIDRQILTQGFGGLIAAGQSWVEALATIRAINPAIAVTGANAQQLAGALTTAAVAFDFNLAKPELATSLLDKMTVAGRAGKAELEDLSGIVGRIGVNAASAGMSFGPMLGFVEQLSQTISQPEQLATLADSTLRLFTNAKYRKAAAEATGVSFFTDTGERRAAADVLGDIAKQYQQLSTDAERAAFMSEAFGKTDLDTQRGLRILLQKGAIESWRKINDQIASAGGTIGDNLEDSLDNVINQVGRLKAELVEAAEAFAQPINQAVADAIQYLLDDEKKGGLGLSGNQILLGAAGAGVAGYAGYRLGGTLLSSLIGKGGSLAAGLATGEALEQAAGVTPVYVVNMPAGFGGASGVGGSRRGGLGRGLKTGGLIGLAGAGAYVGGQLINSGIDSTDLGRKATAAIDSAAYSGLRNTLGFFGAGNWTDSIWKAISFDTGEPQQIEGTIHVQIDQDGRARVKSVDSNQSGVDIDVDSGPMMVLP